MISILLKYWQLALAGVVAIAGGTAVLIYRGEAQSEAASLVRARSELAITDSAVRQQNQWIATLHAELVSTRGAVLAAERQNRKSKTVIETVVHDILIHPVGPTCQDALSYLRSQAPSLSH